MFPGGCFFVATSAELGARPGRVHDRVAAYQQQWRELLQHTAQEAQSPTVSSRPTQTPIARL